MPDREKVIKQIEVDIGKANRTGEMLVHVEKKTATDAIAMLKEQESIKQKMWNALYTEEDKLEKQYAGTDKNDDWFFVYRPWLQRGFEIAIEVIAKQED